ncbi:MAG: hypothetical protein COA42_11630 [Alteromonadaceae bacterium]|nr:MAG: hypothetical protein COA42_11630 [Alteromonadaceae bacterium]
MKVSVVPSRLFLPLLLLCLFTTACSTIKPPRILDQTIWVNNHKVHRNADWLLSPATRLYLNKPQYLLPDSQPLPRTMARFYHDLRTSMAMAFPGLHQSTQALSLETAFSEARLNGCELLVVPRLISKDDQLNTYQELSEGTMLHPDKRIARDSVMFQVIIYDVRSERLIDVATIKSKARFFSKSNSHALDLFTQAVNQYVKRLSGGYTG